jgi:hypothetical protein
MTSCIVDVPNLPYSCALSSAQSHPSLDVDMNWADEEHDHKRRKRMGYESLCSLALPALLKKDIKHEVRLSGLSSFVFVILVYDEARRRRGLMMWGLIGDT